eukprot:3808220-Ditylum_brightwellii.AAC.1
MMKNLKQSTQGTKLKEYWIRHTLLDEHMINQVDWEAIGHACGNHKFIRKQWSSKLAVNFLPIAMVMEDRGTISTPKCLCNCGAPHKTTDHMMACPKGDNTW